MRTEARRKNLLILILHYLMEEGYVFLNNSALHLRVCVCLTSRNVSFCPLLGGWAAWPFGLMFVRNKLLLRILAVYFAKLFQSLEKKCPI